MPRIHVYFHFSGTLEAATVDDSSDMIVSPQESNIPLGMTNNFMN